MRTFTTASERETEELAARFAKELRAGDVIAYRGGLGVGKTAFTRGLAAGLGAEGDVSSPTFALVHEYRGGRLALFHFDMYRVADWDALYTTGFFEYLEENGVIAVEWSEHIENALPENAIIITIDIIGEQRRAITIEGGGRF